jgi:protein tyrosine/serine phosphatase
MSELSVPIPDSYWVVPGLLLAGEYPGSENTVECDRRLLRFLDASITRFIDLTEPGELHPYETRLIKLAGLKNIHIEYLRFPIEDMGIPSQVMMRNILDSIEQGHTAKKKTYVHCYGGIGRTGTVVGCFLMRQGLTGDQALETIANSRRSVSDWWVPSPETSEQRNFILDWKS